MTVNIRTLRASTRQILSAVSRGATVIVSNRGKACARIIPMDAATPTKVVSLGGLWKDNKKISSVHGFIRQLRQARHVS